MSEDVWSRSDRETRRKTGVPIVLAVASCLIAARAIGGHRWRGAFLAGLSAGAAVWVAVDPERAQTLGRRLLIKLSNWGAGDDLVAEASQESFPASDPPARTPTVGTGLRRQTATH